MDTIVVSTATSWFVSKNHIFAETCLPTRFLETAYMSQYVLLMKLVSTAHLRDCTEDWFDCKVKGDLTEWASLLDSSLDINFRRWSRVASNGHCVMATYDFDCFIVEAGPSNCDEDGAMWYRSNHIGEVEPGDATLFVIPASICDN
jgi:hypothetical protein